MAKAVHIHHQKKEDYTMKKGIALILTLVVAGACMVGCSKTADDVTNADLEGAESQIAEVTSELNG